MRILLVEDHALFREALSLILEQLDDDVTFVFAGNGADARSACGYYNDLDLIIMDLALPDEDGLDLLPALRRQTVTVPIVVVSASEEPDKVRMALEAGAVGYIPKKASGSELLAALKSVLTGETYVTPALLSTMDDPPRMVPTVADSANRTGVLSPRQRQVLRLLAGGLPNKLIARELNLSEGTVKLHVSAIIHTLGTRNRTEAVMEGERRGLLGHDPESLTSN